MYATFLGYLGKDAEVSFTQNQKSMLKFSVAETIGYGDKKKTQWINCVDFRAASAEKLKDYLLKGTLVMVVGEVSENEYTNKDGITNKSLQCVVSNIRLAGGKKDDAPAAKKTETKAADQTFEDEDIPF